MTDHQTIPQLSTYHVAASGNSKVHNGDVYYGSDFCRQASDLNEDKKAAVLSWLPSLDFESIHTQIRHEASLDRERKMESEDSDYTGQWLWKSSAFKQWQSRKLRQLWYHGMPGAGKTTLVSVLVERMRGLQGCFKPSGRHGKVACIYLSHDKDYTIEQLLGSIIKQVVEKDKAFPRPLTELSRASQEQIATKKDVPSLARIIHQLSLEEPIYVFIDGIDEVKAEIGQDLTHFIQPQEQRESGVCVLVTSRTWKGYEDLSRNFHREPISANPGDLRHFINQTCSAQPSFERLWSKNPSLQDEIAYSVMPPGIDVFLVVKLRMQFILPTLQLRTLTLHDLREELDKLRSRAFGLDEMYSATSQRIVERKENDKDAQRAYHILAWVVLSRRPLELSEFEGAMLCDSATKYIGDPRLQATQDTIRDICDGLVTFASGKICLVHSTTKEYFNQNAERLFGDFQAHIANTCAAYLCSKVLEEPVYSKYWKQHLEPISEAELFSLLIDGFGNRHTLQVYQYAKVLLRQFPLVPYALQFLGHHLRRNSGHSTTEAKNNVKLLLDESPKMTFLYRWLQLLNLIQPEDQLRHRRFRDFEPHKVYPEPWVDKGNIRSHHIVEEAIDASKTSSRFPHHSPSNDLDNFLDALIRHLGIEDPGISREEVKTPREQLDTASSFELAQDDRHSTDSTFRSPPAEHKPNAETPIISQLVSVSRLTTPTHIAAWYGYLPILEKYLDKYGDIDAIDEFNRQPIVVALQQGHADAVSVFISHGAQIDLSTMEGQRILFQVLRSDSLEQKVVRAIIRSNHERLDSRESSLTPTMLKIPMFAGCVALASLKPFSGSIRDTFRLNYYCDSAMGVYRRLNSDNIVAATGRGDIHAIKRLLAKNLGRPAHRTMSLFVAVEFESVDMLITLIDGGIDVNTQDPEGNTPLIRASARQNYEMVQALLRKNADVGIRNDKGYTAWSVNLKPENAKVLDLLEDHDCVDPDVTHSDSEPFLYGPSAAGDIRTVQFLLDRKVNPSNCTRFLWTPLHWAAHNGHIECVKALLKHGARHSPMADTGETPLDKAKQGGNWHIVEVLVNEGAVSGKHCYKNRSLHRTSYYHDWTDSDSDDDGSALYHPYERTGSPDSIGSDDSRVFGYQDGFEAALYRLEQRATLSSSTKRKLFEFFFRDIATLISELDELTRDSHSGSDDDDLEISDAASRRWTDIVNSLKRRVAISNILNSQESS